MGKERTPAEDSGKGGRSRPADAFGGEFVPLRDTGAGTALFRLGRAFPVPPPPLPPSRCTVGFGVPTPPGTWRATTFPEVLFHSPPLPPPPAPAVAAAVAVPGSPPIGLGWPPGAPDPALPLPAVPMPAAQQVRGAGVAGAVTCPVGSLGCPAVFFTPGAGDVCRVLCCFLVLCCFPRCCFRVSRCRLPPTLC